MCKRAKFAKIEVRFELREDGGLRAYSPQVPGFVLSHHDAHAVPSDVKPALETILSAMHDAEIVVELLRDLAEVTGSKPETDVFPPPHVREYVIRLAA